MNLKATDTRVETIQFDNETVPPGTRYRLNAVCILHVMEMLPCMPKTRAR